jgi:nicotinamidase-related amidase
VIGLIVIDMQREYSSEGALPVERFDDAVGNVKLLLEAARQSENTVVVKVRHVSRKPGDSSFDAGSPNLVFIEGLEPRPGEFVLTKHYPGAFSNPELERFLTRHDVDTLVICGFTSIWCCDTTAREGFQLGYKVYYVEDATSEFALGDLSADDLHRASNAVQGSAFSEVVSTSTAASLLRSGKPAV